MHIGIDLELQKVNSNVISALKPQEKDWFLTYEMYRFIKQRINPQSNEKNLGFEEDQKRYDDLEALKKTTSLSVSALSNEDAVFAYLPADYMHLTNDRSLVKDLCGLPYSPTTVATNFYITDIIIPLTVTDNYVEFKIKINGTTVYRGGDYFPTGIPTSDAVFEIFNSILDTINKLPGFECKYENFKGVYSKNRLIIASDTIFTLDTEHVINPTTVVTTYTVVAKNLNIINVPTNSIQSDNRLTKSSIAYRMLGTEFGTTITSSPISILRNNTLIVFHKKKFIVSKLNIEYIRRPQRISLISNQSCELNPDVHEEIVVSAAKRIAGITLNQNYRNLMNENLLKE